MFAPLGPKLSKFGLSEPLVACLKQPDHVEGRGVTSSCKNVTGVQGFGAASQTGASQVTQESRPKAVGKPPQCGYQTQ